MSKYPFKDNQSGLKTPINTAFWIALSYALVAILSLLVADWLVVIFWRTLDLPVYLHIMKDMGFVWISAFVLYLLLAQQLKNHRLAQLELYEQNVFWDSVINNSELMIFVVDVEPDGQFRYAHFNEAFERVLGVDKQAFLGKTPDEIVPIISVEKAAYFNEKYAACVSAGHAIRYEFELSFQGYAGWRYTSITPIRDEGGRICRLVGNTFDITDRVRAEKELAASRDSMQCLIQQLPVGIQVFDAQGLCTNVNQKHLELFGIERADLVGKYNIFEDTLAEQMRTKQAAQRALQGEAVALGDLEFDFSAADPRYAETTKGLRTINMTIVPITGHQGQVSKIVSVNLDLTERKEAEETMRAAQQFAQNTLDSLSSHIAIVDAEGTILAVNKAWRDYAAANGGDPDEVNEGANYLGAANVSRLMEEDERSAQAFIVALQRVLSGEIRFFQQEYPCHAPDEECWFEGRIMAFEGSGSAQAVIAHENITARVQLERELQAEKELLRTIIDHIPDSIFIKDAEGRVLASNIAHAQMVGLKPEDVLGNTTYDLYPAHIMKRFKDEDARVVTDGEPVINAERELRAASGECKIMLTTKVPIRNPAGKIIGLLGIGRDITERKQMEQKLLETQRRMQLAVQAANIGLWDWNLQSNQAYHSAEWKRQLGYEEDEIPDGFEQWQNRLHPDDAQHAIQTVKAYFAQNAPGGFYHNEFRLRHKDGSYRWILSQASLLQDEQGNAARLLGAHIDITERKQIENHLRHQAIILQSISDVVMTYDLDFRITSWNQAAENLYGWSAEEVIGRRMGDVISFDYPYETRESTYQKFDRDGEWSGEGLHTTRDGIRLNVLVSVSKVYDDSGEAIGIVGVARNISALKKSQKVLADTLMREQNLRQQADTLRKIAEILSNMSEFPAGLHRATEHLQSLVYYDNLGLYHVDNHKLYLIMSEGHDNAALNHAHDGIDYCESAFLNNLLTTGDPLRTSDMRDIGVLYNLSHTRDVATEIDLLAVSLISRGITIGLLTVSVMNRHFLPDMIAIVHTFANQIAIALDNSQVLADLETSYQRLKDAQDKMVHSARLSAIGELAAGVAHQINNPLMTIVADSHLLLKHLEAEHDGRDSAEAISRAAQRAGDVVQRLLDFSRARSSRMQAVHINESVQHAIDLVRAQIEPHYAQIHAQLAPGLPPIQGSEDHLQDVWINLLLNARDAVRDVKDGMIDVRTSLNEKNTGIKVIIEDNGIGIQPEVISLIFDPFFTLKENGTGLGLAICADIIKQHGGQIAVESTPGGGASFTVALTLNET